MATEILRPNAAGDEENIENSNPGSEEHWTYVDEVEADDFGTHLCTGNYSYQRDLYNLPASVGSGTINFIKIYFRSRRHPSTNAGYAKPALKSNGTITDGTEIALPSDGSWNTYSQQWNTNPADAGAWEWADIDALQIGISIKEEGAYYVYLTQIYVEVDYTLPPPPPPPSTITATAGDNGIITPCGEIEVQYGDDQLFTITPDENYGIEDVLVDGESVGSVANYTFYSVTADHTIEAIFKISDSILRVYNSFYSMAFDNKPNTITYQDIKDINFEDLEV